MKHILLVVLGIAFFSACSDDGIPTGNNVKLVDWNAVKQSSEISSNKDNKNIEEVEQEMLSENENINSKVDTDIEPIPNFDSLATNNDEVEVTQSETENNQNENFQDEKTTSKSGELEIVENTKPQYPDYSDYEKKLESQMKTALVNYSRPPSPANLSPYDSREADTYRKPTTQESSQGSGEFPPMPPSMYLNK